MNSFALKQILTIFQTCCHCYQCARVVYFPPDFLLRALPRALPRETFAYAPTVKLVSDLDAN